MLKKKIKSLHNIKNLLLKKTRKRSYSADIVKTSLVKYNDDEIKNVLMSGDVTKIKKMFLNISFSNKNIHLIDEEIYNTSSRKKYLIIKCLLQNITSFSKIPLHNYLLLASTDGKLDIVKMLLAFKFNTAFNNNQSICAAILNDRWKIFKFLLTSSLVVTDMKPVVTQIIKQNKKPYLKYLKKKNILSPFDMTYYTVQCIKYKNLDLLKIVLEHKKYYDIIDYQKIFTECIKEDFVFGVTYLENNFYCKIKRNADYSKWINISVENSSSTMLKKIIDFNGVFFNDSDIIKNIIYTIHKRYYEKFLILYYQKDLDISSNNNMLLKYVVENNITEVVDMIIKDSRFFNSNEINNIFLTSINKNNKDIVEVFLKNNLIDNDIKQYGLFYADYNKNKEIYDLILKHMKGCDLEILRQLKNDSYGTFDTFSLNYFNIDPTPSIIV